MKKKIGICDNDERYLRFMQDYLEKKRLTDFEVQIFTSVDEVYSYRSQNSMEILLIGESSFQEYIRELGIKKVYILQESSACEIAGVTKVMKYQSMERLISTVLEDYAQSVSSTECIYEQQLAVSKKAKITSFYTPLQTASQTLYALSMAQLLAQEGKRVLYLNLTPFAGFETLLHTSYETDVTDFFYYALKHSDRLGMKLDGIRQKIGEVDYLPPAMDYQDLLSLSAQEWLDGLHQLQGIGVYDEVILDMASVSQGLYELLQASDRIYTVMQPKTDAKAAFAQFQELCIRRRQQGILQRMYEITDIGKQPEKVYYDTLVNSVYAEQMKKVISCKSNDMSRSFVSVGFDTDVKK